MNLRNTVIVGSLLVVVSGCSYLPEGFGLRVKSESPDRLFVNDIDTGQIPVAAPAVATAPERPGLKIRKSKRGNMESYVVRGERYYTLDSSEEYSARGTASWYGPNFHGRTASSGEIYDMYRLTAAHKTLPLPTYARVTHLENGRSVIVKINDRGPFSGDRIIDLSFAAALRLGMINDGTGEVEIQALSPEEVMVLSGPENTLDVDFYHTGDDGATSLVQNDSADQRERANVAAVDVDQTPIIAQPLTENSASTATKANESLDSEQQNAILPVIADVNVQGLVTIPAALQTATANKTAKQKVEQKVDDKSYYIQAGVYADVQYAERVAVDIVLASPGEEVHVKPLKNTPMYRITVGPIVTSDHAAKVSGLLTDAGFDNFTVRAK